MRIGRRFARTFFPRGRYWDGRYIRAPRVIIITSLKTELPLGVPWGAKQRQSEALRRTLRDNRKVDQDQCAIADSTR